MLDAPEIPRDAFREPLGRPDALRLLALVGAVLLANLPFLARLEVESEEGRRLLPARSMLETGEWVEPRIWDRPYLAKPPLFYWCVAATAGGLRALGLDGLGRLERADLRLALDGTRLPPDAVIARIGPEPLPPLAPVSPLAARLPSVLAAAATVALVYLLCRRSLGAVASTVAAGCVASAPALLGKATLGEIELVLALLCFAGTAAAWLGQRGPLAWSALGGVLIGAAVLAKGPIAYAFALPPVLAAAALDGERRGRALAAAALAAALSLAVPGAWLALLLAGRGDGGAVGEAWAGELGRGGFGGLAVYLADRWRLLYGVLLGWLPATLLALAGWRACRRTPLGRFAALAVACGLVLLFAWPGVRARYALPLLPWVGVLAGVALERSHCARRVGFQAARALSFVLLFPLVLGVPLVLFVLAKDPHAVTALPSAWGGAFVALALAAVGAARLRGARTAGAALLALALFALAGRLVERTLIEPAKAHQRQRALGAAVLRLAAGDGAATVRVGLWSQFNLLYYTGWRARWADGPDDVEPGQLWVSSSAAGPPGPAEVWEPLCVPVGRPAAGGRPGPEGAVLVGDAVLGAPWVGADLRALALWRRRGAPR